MTWRSVADVVGELQLHRGYSYCVVMTSEIQRRELLDGLLRWRKASIVSHDGSLISNLTAAENIALPAYYGSANGVGQALRFASVFYSCGLIDERGMQALLMKLPEQMTLYEKRMVGFMRANCVEPELIVYDSIYEGLAHQEVELVNKFDECFHLQFPFRTSVLLSFENAYRPAASSLRMIYLDDAFK